MRTVIELGTLIQMRLLVKAKDVVVKVILLMVKVVMMRLEKMTLKANTPGKLFL